MASSYSKVVESRIDYLAAVDRFVTAFLGRERPSRVIDIGTGDGRRISNLSKAVATQGLQVQFEGVEPSVGMRELAITSAPFARIYNSVDEIDSSVDGKFDGATMLWNVLGHAAPGSLLPRVAGHLQEGAFLLLDINLRYNVRTYGLPRVLNNFVRDLLSRQLSEARLFTASFEGVTCPVWLHNTKSLHRELWNSGFQIEDIVFLDYKSGEERRSQLGGQGLVTARLQRETSSYCVRPVP
jgi:2-polyprenyl-3-methyl-5-hydroxy-6-metoxy-1,4-benzoquinol methylase